MRIIKYTHACVRLEHAGGVLVIDPGVWAEPAALTGADAVLLTHQHADHVDVDRLSGLDLDIYAPADAEIPGLPVVGVASGDEFTAAGFDVRAVGNRHAFIYASLPDCANLGYLVGGSLYHPGDALHVPDQPVQTLLVPAQGPWLKTAEAIDFATAVKAERTFPIHDAGLSDRGLGSINSWFGRQVGAGYRYLAPGEATD
jgi:L-ascorbate metabolism protein UlaG (beta-lactamase superfamily)